MKKVSFKENSEDVFYIDKERLINNPSSFVEIRGRGNLKQKALYLYPQFDWVLGKDNTGSTVLIPLKKGEIK